MADAAESVIFSGIQKGNVGAAKYYLSNNEQRYMSPAKVEQHRRFEGELINQLKSELPDVKEYPVFEHAFNKIHEFEKGYGDQFDPEFYNLIINKYAILFARFDGEIVEVFKASAEWKKDKEDLEGLTDNYLDENKSE